MPLEIPRRRFLLGAAGGVAAVALGGCGDQASESPWVQEQLGRAEDVNRWVQRHLEGRAALAREFAASDISPAFKANGTTSPDSPEYRAMADNGFADWRLDVGGLVERPAGFTLAELMAMPARSQITRHDCVEGWSCIGGWTGVPLGTVLARVGLRPGARYVVLRCADDLDGDRYYESIDLIDAFHPQTILAYAMNGSRLTVPHGAPLRLRVERQLGYKMAKYLTGIEVVSSFAAIAGGRGGYWEDQGYEW